MFKKLIVLLVILINTNLFSQVKVSDFTPTSTMNDSTIFALVHESSSKRIYWMDIVNQINDSLVVAKVESLYVYGDVRIVGDYQIYGQLEYKSFTIPLLEFSTVARDTIFPIPNEYGTTITIDSIKVLSTLDNQDLKVIECDKYGGNVNVISDITVTTDPTGNEKFYHTKISSIQLVHQNIESEHRIGFVRSTTASEEILPTIYFHYNKQKKEETVIEM